MNIRHATIAVITCQRPRWLLRLLEELSRQTRAADTIFDILIVDNASDRQLKKKVEEFNDASPLEYKYVAEADPGIVAARNCAVKAFLESKSEYLIFIDDDEWPASPDWAQSLVNKVTELSCDIVTGNVISIGETGVSNWAVDLIYGKCRFTEGKEIFSFYTNNLLITRRVLEAINPPFDPRFAMTGGSDYHFAVKCIKRGFTAKFVESPVYETLPLSRANVQWFMRRGFRCGACYTRSHMFEDPFFNAIFRCSAMSLARFGLGSIYLLTGLFCVSKLKAVNGLFRLSSAAGTIAGFLGITYEEYKSIHGR